MLGILPLTSPNQIKYSCLTLTITYIQNVSESTSGMFLLKNIKNFLMVFAEKKIFE